MPEPEANFLLANDNSHIQANELSYQDRLSDQDTHKRMSTLFGDKEFNPFGNEDSQEKQAQTEQETGEVNYETVDEVLTSDTTEMEAASEMESGKKG